MKTSGLAPIVALGSILAGCGSGSGSADASADGATGGAAAAAPSSAANLVDRALVDSCAGFDAAKAADMLGVPAAELEVQELFSERLGGQSCRYWSADSNIGPGLQFLLHMKESSEEAVSLLANQRSVVPALEGAAGNVAAVPATGPALLEFDGIGDEAFWDTNTGGVNVRVRNVVATIHASLSRNSVSDRNGEQIALERRIAEEIADALDP